MYSSTDVAGLVRALLAAFTNQDRAAAEALLADDFTFSSPDDPHLDRAGYFRRCWPGSALVDSMEIERLFAEGDEAFVLYRAAFQGKPAFRNTEHLTARGGQLVRVEVYYGATVEAAAP
jgi:ketosteroid isomerase-like protein